MNIYTELIAVCEYCECSVEFLCKKSSSVVFASWLICAFGQKGLSDSFRASYIFAQDVSVVSRFRRRAAGPALRADGDDDQDRKRLQRLHAGAGLRRTEQESFRMGWRTRGWRTRRTAGGCWRHAGRAGLRALDERDGRAHGPCRTALHVLQSRAM